MAQTKKPDEDPTFDPYPGDLRLSYSLEYDEKKADDGSSLVSVIMTILALDGEMVKVDNIEIKTIKKADGDVSYLSIRYTHHFTDLLKARPPLRCSRPSRP